MRRCLLIAAVLVAGCAEDRQRPGPVAPGETELTARVLQPVTGATIRSGQDILVQVEARDVNQSGLRGVGFVARRNQGSAVIDSGGFRFSPRQDTTHFFTFLVPESVPTNTQVDVYGIAYGPGSDARLSTPVHLTVSGCGAGGCE